jgi:hypothetical protein
MKGKRYKFKIEDMVQEKLTVSNFNQFRETTSYHYMNERNSGNSYQQKLLKWKKDNPAYI